MNRMKYGARKSHDYEKTIATTVLAEGGVLVTHNTDEFERVKGLEIVDWCENC